MLTAMCTDRPDKMKGTGTLLKHPVPELGMAKGMQCPWHFPQEIPFTDCCVHSLDLKWGQAGQLYYPVPCHKADNVSQPHSESAPRFIFTCN